MKSRLILVLVIGLLACQERRSGVAVHDSASNEAQRPTRRIGFDQNGQPSSVALEEVVVSGASDALPAVHSDMVIRTADVSIAVDSLELAIAQVRDLAARFGGYVANTTIAAGRNQLRNATLELKIPAPRFDASLSGLSPIGELESVSIEAEDVGEQFVDVTARMENARRLERRLIDLLATRTGKLKDVLDVEQELARVREEIERYEGRLRYLRAHTAVSSMSVSVHEPVPIVVTAGHSVMGEAFRQAWRNFVALLSLAVQSLGVLIPLGALAFVVWIVVKRVRRVETQAAA